jgi:hypothetical protein
MRASDPADLPIELPPDQGRSLAAGIGHQIGSDAELVEERNQETHGKRPDCSTPECTQSMTADPSGMVRLGARRTGNTPQYYGIYAFDAQTIPGQPDTQTPWRCDTCRWWEVIPDFAHDPSGRHGMCLLAELQDAPDTEQSGPGKLKRFLADDGMATTADFGCLEWQAAIVPASEPWLTGADGEGWRFPGVETTYREREGFPDGGHRPGGLVTTYQTPDRRAASPTPTWACRSCRWFLTSTPPVHQLRGGICSLVAKADLIPASDDPCVFLKAFAGEDGLDTAEDFGCAMWNDDRYEGLPEREWR